MGQSCSCVGRSLAGDGTLLVQERLSSQEDGTSEALPPEVPVMEWALSTVPRAQPLTADVEDVVGVRCKRAGRYPGRMTIGFLPYWRLSGDWKGQIRWSALDVLAFFAFEAKGDGSLLAHAKWPVEGLITMAHKWGVDVVLTVRQFDASVQAELLASDVHQTSLVQNIVHTVMQERVDGVCIDFEGTPSDQKNNLVAFMSKLNNAMKAVDPRFHVSQCVPASDWTHAFDYKGIIECVDYMVVMGYDQHTTQSSYAGPVAGYEWIRSRMEFIVDKAILAEKIILAVPFYGYEWPVLSSDVEAKTKAPGRSITYNDVVRPNGLASTHRLGWHDTHRSPYYQSKGVTDHKQGWYEDEESLDHKYALVVENGMAGIGIWALTFDGGRLWDHVEEDYLRRGLARIDAWDYYTMKRGDYPFKVAKMTGADLGTLMSDNKLDELSAATIPVGTRLKIRPEMYTVVDGDTPETIGTKLAVSPDLLLIVNKMEGPITQHLQVGSRLRIPPQPPRDPMDMPDKADLVETIVISPLVEGNGLQAEYWNGVEGFDAVPSVTRVDPEVNFQWNYASPDSALEVDNFSARWTGFVLAAFSETYTFYCRTDDGVRLWIGSVGDTDPPLIDNWKDQRATEVYNTITLQGGEFYPLRMEFYDSRSVAVAELRWSSSSLSKEIIPFTHLFTQKPLPPPPQPEGPLQTGLLGVYFAGTEPQGTPLLDRNDKVIDFQWDVEGEWDTQEAVSVRWSGWVVPSHNGEWSFYCRTRDGCRLWVNDELLIDDWQAHGLTESSAGLALRAGGYYPLKMEYLRREGQTTGTAQLYWSSALQTKEIIPSGRMVSVKLPPAPSRPTGGELVSGILSSFFAGTELQGPPLLQRVDPTINFQWGDGSPEPGVVPEDTFSVRWSGWLIPPFSEEYTISCTTDDGCRLWIGDSSQPLVDQWRDQPPTEVSGTIFLRCGGYYPLKMEMYESAENAMAELRWASASQAREIIPTTRLVTTPAPLETPPPDRPDGDLESGLLASFFAGRELSGSPLLERTVATVDFNWGGASPFPGVVPADKWSARFAGWLVPRYSERYTLTCRVDDGVRLWIEDMETPLIDAWRDQPPTEHSASIVLKAGGYYNILIEYYENMEGAVLELSWSSHSQPVEKIPATQFVSRPSAQVAPTPPGPLPDGMVNGIAAQFYANVELEGPAAMESLVPTINFNWGFGSPGDDLGVDNWSSRFLGCVVPPYTDEYTFFVRADDAVRLWVGACHDPILDKWDDEPTTEHTSQTITLAAGTLVPIRLEFRAEGEVAMLELRWQSTQQERMIISTNRLVTETLPYGLRGEYFAGMQLSGAPHTIRTDTQVNFDWSLGGPDLALGTDEFSVRWSGFVRIPTSGTYVFYTCTDDGVRLWVNGHCIIDAWKDQPATEHSGTIDLVGHARVSIRMEFYERSGAAVAKLLWTPPGRKDKEVLPCVWLSHSKEQAADTAEDDTPPEDAEYAVLDVIPAVIPPDEFVTDPSIGGLFSIQQLVDWKPNSDPFNVTFVSRMLRQDHVEGPRILHCHDMMGGYVQDSHPHGEATAYVYGFQHWQYVDMFIYFSHALVSRPPPVWITAAHRHGVHVLGTILAEGDPTMAVALLDGQSGDPDFFVKKLVDMAQYYNFDGWFVNIETDLGSPANAQRMIRFVELLTREMHQMNPESVVMWYDSLTTAGNVAYQNGLTSENKAFFDACDGIFTNYWWTANTPATSAAQSGSDRARDVFMGIDVFGRNTFGGGGFDTHVALAAVEAGGTSAAIFAPGWTYEKSSDPEDYVTRETRFWTGVDSSMQGSEADCVATYVSERCVAGSLPFITNFDRGFGRSFSVMGEVVSHPKEWAHLGLQNHQPTYHNRWVAGAAAISASFTFDAPYDGGTSLVFEGDLESSTYTVLQLFKTHFAIGQRRLSVTYCIHNRCSLDAAELCVLLILKSGKALCLGGSQLTPERLEGDVESLWGGDATKLAVVAPAKITSRAGDWIKREYQPDWQLVVNETITAMHVACLSEGGGGHYCVALGEIAVLDRISVPTTDLVTADLTSFHVSEDGGVSLTWHASCDTRHTDVYVDQTWAARTTTNIVRLQGLASGPHTIGIRPVNVYNGTAPLDAFLATTQVEIPLATVEELSVAPAEEERARVVAATKIQSLYRGHTARKQAREG